MPILVNFFTHYRWCHRWRQIVIVAVAVSVLLGVVGVRFAAQARALLPAIMPGGNPVVAAWKAALERGAYQFVSDVTQTTIPVTTISNVGKASREQRLRLEGDNDLNAQTMHLRLWSGDGRVTKADSGVEVRVADGKTYIRETGQSWQERSDLTGALAPNGDFMSYLAGLHNVQKVTRESKMGFSYTRYRFDLDGPSIAAYIRNQMQATLAERGELPPGLNLEAPDQFARMSGAGEIWVRDDGLPLRQVLDLRFPAQRDEYVTAHIDTTFHNFAPIRASALPAPEQIQRSGLNALLVIVSLALMGVLIVYRRSRTLYAALAISLITALVVAPLLQNHRVVSFLDMQTARAQATEHERTEQEMVEQLRQAVSAPSIDPHADPLVVAAQQEVLAQELVASTLQFRTATALSAPNDNTDTDGDGLTDFNEERIGTLPDNPDTDGDGIPDGLEVMGWRLGNQTWYSDPHQSDSNRDGIADGAEWSNDGGLTLLDTDGDGIPDIWDDDNDNDGVSDRYDLNPFRSVRPAANQTFNDATPLQLTLNGLEAGQLTLVDFQLRPNDPAHLWYALNVLDWPRDNAGQLQDDDGATFADVALAEGRMPDPAENNGDLRLVPILEIRFERASANLPSEADLAPYGIAVNDFVADGSQQVAYVPLSVVSNADTGERQAFQGRMIYQPTGAWNTPHQVRLLWVVQMLVDVCAETNDGVCTRYEQMNQLQAVQAYPDEWFLTGLTVREERGTDLAVIYQSPSAAVPAPYQASAYREDGAVWALIYGLDTTFLAARDENNDGQRDITLAEIAANNGASIAGRWDIPNVLRVDQRSYDTLDRAIATTGITVTTGILNDVFTPARASNSSLRPLLLFAREERYRTASLEGGAVANGANVAVSLQGAEVTTLAGLKLSSYCATGSGANTVWSQCDRASEWDEQARRYSTDIDQQGGNDAVRGARLTWLRYYYMALASGITVPVQLNATLLPSPRGFQRDSDIGGIVGGAGRATTGLVVFLVDLFRVAPELMTNPLINFLAIQREISSEQVSGGLGIGGIVKEKASLAQFWDRLGRTGQITLVVVTVLVVALLITGVVLLAVFVGGPVVRALMVTALFLPILVQLFTLVNRIVAVVQLVQSGASASSVLRGSSALTSASRTGLAVGAIIGVAVVWGVFIANVVLSGASPFSPQFNALLAQAIIQSVLVIAMAIISATVIGALILGIVALIDGILTAICELGVDELRRTPGLNGACFTINTAVTTAITQLFYSFSPIIDAERPDLIVPGAPHIRLANPALGFVEGNPLHVTMPVTTTLQSRGPRGLDRVKLLPYEDAFYTLGNFRSSAFRYSLTNGRNQNLNVNRGDVDDWQNITSFANAGVSGRLYRGQIFRQPALAQSVSLAAGLNRSLDLRFNLAYALPAYECWTVPIGAFFGVAFLAVPVCYLRSFEGNSSNALGQLRYDIMPATLDEFMATVVVDGDGRRLAWDDRFPILLDADGDGLRTTARNGMDPNDNDWDSDNDGLSDRVEMEWRARGVALSPLSLDTDGDGLTDLQELALGSNPTQVDSDNDGLRDDVEIRRLRYDLTTGRPTTEWVGGWTIVLTGTQPLTLWVESDPLLPDTDGDGISDQAERELALSNANTCGPDGNASCRLDPDGRPYHPQIFNTNPLGVFVTVDDVDRVVRPNQSFTYSTTVVNRGAPFADGGLAVSSPAVLSPALSTFRLPLGSVNSVTQSVNFTVAGNAGNGPISILSRAQARLQNNGLPPWSWAAATPGLFGPSVPANRRSVFGDIATSLSDRGDSYAVASQIRNQNIESGTNWGQQLWVLDTYALGRPTGNQLLAAADSAPDGQPQVACNDQGLCLTVWTVNNRATDPVQRIRGAFTNAAITPVPAPTYHFVSSPPTPDSNGRPRQDFSPTVASNGLDFLVVWERVSSNGSNGTQTEVWYRYYGANGQPLGDQTLLSGSAQTVATSGLVLRPHTAFDVVWIGAHYRMLHKTGNLLRLTDINSQGAVVRSNIIVHGAVVSEFYREPRIAYDPNSGRSFAVFEATGGEVVALLFSGASEQRTQLTLFNSAAGRRAPQVAWHPAVGGWLVTTAGNNRLFYDVYTLAGVRRGDLPGQFVDWSVPVNIFDTAVACPAPGSVPDAWLAFEELPGATSFDDSTNNDNRGSCSGANCPLAGLPGRHANDLAVGFNGVNQFMTMNTNSSLSSDQTFSIAFWMRTSDTSGPNNLSSWRNGRGIVTANDFGVSISGGRLFFGTGAFTYFVDGLADGQWHYVVASQNGGVVRLWTDRGVAGAGVGGTPVTFTPQTLTIGRQAAGGNFFNGEIANLAIYDAAIRDTTAAQLRNDAAPSHCLAAGRPSNGGVAGQVATLQLNLLPNETRGGLITNSATLNLTVDATPPTSTVTSVAHNSYLVGNPDGSITHIIGGVAADAYGIEMVEVNVNNTGWQRAEGGAAWSFALQATGGEYKIETRATDNTGNQRIGPGATTVYVDNRAPLVTVNAATNALLHPARLPYANRYSLALQGTASDPVLAGNRAGSGIASVEVLVQDDGAAMSGADWQPATWSNGEWSILYHFAEGAPNPPRPDGVYTVQVRATDQVGLATVLEVPVRLDSAAPTVEISAGDANTDLITSTLTLSGVISDVTGVATVEAAFTPVQRNVVISDAIVYMPFDEPANTLWLEDITAAQQHVTCPAESCITGVAGVNNNAVRIHPGAAGFRPIEQPNRGQFDFAADQSFSIQAWVNTTQPAGYLVSKRDANTGFALYLEASRPRIWVNGVVISSRGGLFDVQVSNGQWHQIVAVIDRSSNEAVLYVNGLRIGEGTVNGAVFDPATPNQSLTMGGQLVDNTVSNGFNGLLDEVAVFGRALDFERVRYLRDRKDVPWLPVTLAQPGGTNTAWSIGVPSGLEGQYQLDLRTSDTRGNRAIQGYVWRGIIDTLAPRLSFGADVTENTALDPQTGETMYEVLYGYAALDRHLARPISGTHELFEGYFNGPCNGSTVERTPVGDAEAGGLFPDLTLIGSFETYCSRWEPAQTQLVAVEACDSYNHCSSQVITVTAPSVVQASAAHNGAPKAVIIQPTRGSFVSGLSGFDVTVAAGADQSLRRVEVLLDDVVVQTFDFTQDEAVTLAQRTVALTAAEGVHTLSARATDWAGAVQAALMPITVTVDTQPPTIEIDGETMTDADTYNGNITMLRFHGVVSDTIGLAAVQISVNGGPWQPVRFDAEGNWRTAIYVPDDHTGNSLTCDVRAIDKAGNITVASKPMLTEFTALSTLVMTQLTEKQVSGRTATFAFTGSTYAGEPVTGFLCRLDGGEFTACASPVTYTGLGDGQHTFHVIAVDAKGNFDVTPAGYIWSVTDEQPPVASATMLLLPLVANNSSASTQFALGADVTISAAPGQTQPDLVTPEATTSAQPASQTETAPAADLDQEEGEVAETAVIEEATLLADLQNPNHLLYLPVVSR